MTVGSAAGTEVDDADPYEGLKTCNKCGEDKPHNEFYANPTATDGLRAECKICLNKIRKEAYAQRHKATDVEVAQLNRAEKLVKGFLEVTELTDYELNNQCIEVDDGTGRYIEFNKLDNRPGNRWRDKVNKELSNRINKYIKSKSLRAVEVIFDIADSELVEPGDRLKAATWLAERVIGKTPEVLLTGDAGKAYEQIFDTAVESGSREEFRNRVNGGGNAALAELESANKKQGSGNNSAPGLDNDSQEILDAEVEEDEYVERKPFKEVSDSEDWDAEAQTVGYGSESGSQTSGLGDSGQNRIRGFSESISGGDANSFEAGDGRNSDSGFTDAGEKRSEALADKERLRKARQKAKQRRFAARALGITSLDRMPYQLEFSLIKTGAMAGKLRCRLVCPNELTEARLAKLEATNALTDEALKILYGEVEDESVSRVTTESDEVSSVDSSEDAQDGEEIIISDESSQENRSENGNE